MNKNLIAEFENLKQNFTGAKLIEAEKLLYDFIKAYPKFDNEIFKIIIGQFIEDENETPMDNIFIRIIHPVEFETFLLPNQFQNYKVYNWTYETYHEIMKDS